MKIPNNLANRFISLQSRSLWPKRELAGVSVPLVISRNVAASNLKPINQLRPLLPLFTVISLSFQTHPSFFRVTTKLRTALPCYLFAEVEIYKNPPTNSPRRGRGDSRRKVVSPRLSLAHLVAHVCMRACVCDDRSRNNAVGVCVTHVRCRGGVSRFPEGPDDPPLGRSRPPFSGSAASFRLVGGRRFPASLFFSRSSLLADGSGALMSAR